MPPTSDPADLGAILSVWAHPDDETYLSGGLMAAAAANGQRVVCVSATAGELGTDDPQRWTPERLGRVRRWEAAAAMAILGVTDHRWMDLPDGGLADLDPEAPVAELVALFEEVQPDTTLTFGPDGGTFHPDHQTVSRWVGAAWERAGRPGRLYHQAITASFFEEWADRYEEWGVYMSDQRPVAVPDDLVDIRLALSGPALDQKVAALTAMHTQVAPAIALLGREDYATSNSVETFAEAPPAASAAG